jgi:hypothetical protein
MPTTLKPYYLDFPQSMTVQKVLEDRLNTVPELSEEEKGHLKNFLRKLEWAVDGWERDRDNYAIRRELDAKLLEKSDEQPEEPPETGGAED